MSPIFDGGRFVALVLALAISPSIVSADSGGDMQLASFHPALDSKGLVTLDRSGVLGHKEFSFGLVTHWAAGLLKMEGNGNTYEVENMLSPTLVGALGFRPLGLDLQLGVAVPFRVISGDRGPDSDNGTPDNPNDDRMYGFEGQGLGNVEVQLKWRLLNTSHSAFGMALVAGADLPTTSESKRWLGSGTTTPHAHLALDRDFGKLSLAVNLGIRVPLGKTEFVDDTPPLVDGIEGPMTGQRIVSGLSVPAGIGLAYALAPQRVDFVAELFGQYAPDAENYQPLEALAGLKVYLADRSYLSLGAGAGLRAGAAGSPDWRGYLGIVFEPRVGDRDFDGKKDDVDECPDEPEDYDDFDDADGCPDFDNDRDGIMDVEDRCPLTPEDRDGVEDEDGCPENEAYDRDGDRILDDVDQCPDDPEDYDEFRDTDGCPDLDNDEDTILDTDDLCPDDPEDFDRFEDRDGCPDIDNDRDRILDADDECPREDGETLKETQETYNTVDDEDGCPDRGPVELTRGGIVILKEINFRYDSAEILENSFEILRAVAMTLETNPDLSLIEVQGHTDARGSVSYNLELSQRRAESVVSFLVGEGVDATRLNPVGYGEGQPKIRKHNEEAWAVNRRVEFIIAQRL